MPFGVERAVVRATGIYDYLPTRAGLGRFRYHGYAGSSAGIRVSFRSGGREVVFGVYMQPVRCLSGPGAETGGPMQTFRINGVRIYWRGTKEDHEAWRCVRARDGSRVTLEASDCRSERSRKSWPPPAGSGDILDTRPGVDSRLSARVAVTPTL